MSTMTKPEIQKIIADGEKALDSKYYPENLKPQLQAKIDKAKEDLAAYDKVLVEEKKLEKQETALQETKPATPQAKTALKAVKADIKKEKPKVAAEKKQAIIKVKQATANIKSILARAPKAVQAFNQGRSEADIQRDKQRTAKKPGKKVSATGNTYYESRPSHTDANRKVRLAAGGAVSGKLLPIGYEITVPSFGMDKNVKMKLKEIVPIKKEDGEFSYHFVGSKNRSQYYPEPRMLNLLKQWGMAGYAAGGAVKNPATLTAEENKAWEKYFEYYINEGKSDNYADKHAWQDLQNEFPRLKEYDGIATAFAKGGGVEERVFGFIVDLDERGDYRAHIENVDGDVIWETDLENTNQLIEDGFLKYKPDEDLERLAKYLSDAGVLPKGSEIKDDDDFENYKSIMQIGDHSLEDNNEDYAKGGKVKFTDTFDAITHMNTPYGKIEVYSGSSFPLNDDVIIYHAKKDDKKNYSSIFWIVNSSDADKLFRMGYNVTEIKVKSGYRPRSFNNGDTIDTILAYAAGGVVNGGDDFTVVVYDDSMDEMVVKTKVNSFIGADDGLDKENEKAIRSLQPGKETTIGVHAGTVTVYRPAKLYGAKEMSVDIFRAVAAQFAKELHKELDAEQIAEINRLNATPEYKERGLCATHNFCDANMPMLAAFCKVLARDFTFYNDDMPGSEKQNEIDTDIMNAAWDVAREGQFDVERIEKAEIELAKGGEVLKTEKVITVPNAENILLYWGRHGDIYADGNIALSFVDFDKIEVSISENYDGDIESAIETVESVITNAGLYAAGGRPLSALNRDRKYVNESQLWETKYKRKKRGSHYMAAGGAIKNQYYGKLPHEVWQAWTEEQRKHFLEDHVSGLTPSIITVLATRDYSELDGFARNILENHVAEGQYAAGGSLSGISYPAYFGTSENINVFGYQTENFINSPIACKAILNAREYVTSKTSGKQYDEASEALKKLTETIDEVLGMEKWCVDKGFSETADFKTLVMKISLMGIYNMQAGSIVDFSGFIAQHVTNIAKLYESNSSSLSGTDIEILSNIWQKASDHRKLSFEDCNELLKIIQRNSYASGGRLKSALMRDRAYLSDEPHEQAYNNSIGGGRHGYMEKGGKIDVPRLDMVTLKRISNDYYNNDNPFFIIKKAKEQHHNLTKKEAFALGRYIENLQDYANKRKEQDLVVGLEDFKTELMMDKSFANGGRLKSALMRDRAYLSQQPHEQAYNESIGGKRKRYSMSYGGMVKKVDNNIEKLISHYLPNINKDDIYQVYEVMDKEGQYMLDSDRNGDGTKCYLLTIYCGNKITEIERKLETDDDYHDFAINLFPGVEVDISWGNNDECLSFSFTDIKDIYNQRRK
jgi:Fe-S cluster biosynthesis and repair protein YggX